MSSIKQNTDKSSSTKIKKTTKTASQKKRKHNEHHDQVNKNMSTHVKKIKAENNKDESCIEKQEIVITTKKINKEKHHVWIYMKGKGNVRLEYVMEKIDELQDILNNIDKVPLLQFTFVFDFRLLFDFADFKTLYKFGAFMQHNKSLFERRLRLSYLLLRYWSWKATVKTLFFAFPPTKPVKYKIPQNIDKVLQE